MANKRHFCMIHEGRCGSTVLGSLIHQHPAIVHFSEILTRRSWISDEFEGSELETKRNSLEIKLPDLVDFISHLSTTLRATDKPDHQYIGFEIKLNQLSSLHLNCDLATLVNEISSGLENVRFMFLTRRNILRRHVSTLRCLYKNVSHAQQMNDVNFEKVRVEHGNLIDWSYGDYSWCQSLADLLEISENRRSSVRDFALTNGHLYMEYEEFEKNPLSGAERIFDYLELPRVLVKSPLLKTGDLALADLVENYDEVKAELKDTRWAGMLD